MPEIVRIGGARIEMFFGDHNPPHFHVTEAGMKAKIEIATLEVMAGKIRRSTYRRVRRWAEGNREFLVEHWDELQ